MSDERAPDAPPEEPAAHAPGDGTVAAAAETAAARDSVPAAARGNLNGARTFVGFGFGAIQSGLFLYEAWRSGEFGRLVVAEVVPETVAAVRAADGRFTLNIAHATGVEQATIGPIEIYNPLVADDRAHLIGAIADADEMATAVPSIANYVSDSPGSLHRVLAAGLHRKQMSGGPFAVLYAAENHNQAAEALREQIERALQREHVREEKRADVLARVSVVNTVIGKMSGIVPLHEGPPGIPLAPVTPGSPRAFLVEEFNRILVSRVEFVREERIEEEPPNAPGDDLRAPVLTVQRVALDVPFARGIQVFQEKDDLLPFEEAKLYGHNALHALAAYLGAQADIHHMHRLHEAKGLLKFVRNAVLQEPGAALLRKHQDVDDPLFTPAGFAAYADDLIERMVNPFLQDAVARVARDPARKLGWDDRLIGPMRLALEQGITPRRFALGAAAALKQLHAAPTYPEGALDVLWRRPPQEVETVRTLRGLVREAWGHLHEWTAAGCPDPETMMRRW